jgi:hypothetical protein
MILQMLHLRKVLGDPGSIIGLRNAHTIVRTANASSRPSFFTKNNRAYKRTSTSKPAKQTMNKMPTIAE